jgi:hypothetical protein
MTTMKNLIQHVRLVLSALQVESVKGPIAEYHMDNIAEARASVAGASGPDVLAAVSAVVRSGVPLTYALRDTTRIVSADKSQRFRRSP